MKQKNSDKWSVQISKELAEKLKKQCAIEGKTLTSVVEQGVKYYIDHGRFPISKSFKKFICKISPERPSLPSIPSFLIKQVTRPKFTIEKSSNDAFKWTNKKWHPLTMVIYDAVSPNAAQIINNIIYTETKFDLEIEMLDDNGKTIEKWLIKNGNISSADFGTLDWESNSSPEIIITVEYEFAQLDVINSENLV